MLKIFEETTDRSYGGQEWYRLERPRTKRDNGTSFQCLASMFLSRGKHEKCRGGGGTKQINMDASSKDCHIYIYM